MNKILSLLDYTAVGLVCGLEIHQQLDTGKLFCRCPSTLQERVPDITIVRMLQARAGETGKVDVAAMHEMEKKKRFLYEGYDENTCLVDFDEEPPHTLNVEALSIVVQIAQVVHARCVDEIHVMRKTVVDGSNTSGFQRTGLVALNGYITVAGKQISIPTVAIEEEAARKIREDDKTVTYRLDRLGIPLIEISTGPDITTPEQAKEVAEYLGMVLRSTEKVKRGLGTIRQDVNVSIKEGTRIEIKGAQDLKAIPLLVMYEAQRQHALVELKKELEKKQILCQETETHNVTAVFQNTRSAILKKALDKKDVVLGKRVPFFHTLLGRELQPGKRLGTECSERAKNAAGVGGLFHSDEDLKKYGITEEEIAGVKKELSVTEQDAFILVADTEEKAHLALRAASQRISDSFHGVPKEVRKANEDSTTSFLRPMPGAARMYPETDIPPITPPVVHSVPELLHEKAQKLVEKGVQEELATGIAKAGKTNTFLQFVLSYPSLKPSFMAEVYMSMEKILRRKYVKDIPIPDQVFHTVFEELAREKIQKESIEQLFVEYATTGKIDFASHTLLGQEQLKAIIREIREKNPSTSKEKLLGFVMAKVRGKADPQKVKELLF